MIAGTCGPPQYRDASETAVSSVSKDFQYPNAEEIAALVKITNRPSHDCNPDISPDGKSLAFDSWEPYDEFRGSVRDLTGGAYNVWLVSTHGGTGYQRVTNSTADDYYPAWYPDGERILFTSERPGYPSIWAKSATGLSGTQKLSWLGTYDFSGDVSPDGKFIVFSAADDFAGSKRSSWYDAMPEHPGIGPYDDARYSYSYSRIYRIDADGARLTELGTGFDPQVSPDGKSIVYSSWEAGNWDIWVMDINGSNKTQLTTETTADIDPCWSPDGRWIAFSKGSYGTATARDQDYWNIWVISVDGGAKIQKTFSRSFSDLAPCWDYVDEGDRYRDYIFFHSDRDNFEYTGFDIYRLDPDMGIEEYDIPDKSKGVSVRKGVDITSPGITGERPRIQVLNSTSRKGWAAQVAEELRANGLNVIFVGNTKHEKNLPHGKIYYRPEYNEFAYNLALNIPGAQYIYLARWDMGNADITIVLGGKK